MLRFNLDMVRDERYGEEMEKHRGRNLNSATAMKKGRFFLVWLICLIVCMSQFAWPETAKAEGKQIVRVGYVPSDEFLKYSDEGGHAHYEGFMAEFLEVMSFYGNWEYEFISGSWEECTKWIADGTIDLLPGAMEENAGETVSLSKLPINITWDNIYVPDGVEAQYGDYQVLDNAKIAYMRGGYTNEEFFRKHDIDCELVPCDTYADMEEAMENGTVNAIMGIGKKARPYTLLARVSPRMTYMGFSNHNPELMAQLESAYEQLMMEMPDLLDNLQAKYIGKTETNNVVLSQMEKAWVAENPTISIAYVENRKPQEYESEEGEAKGIHVDLIEAVLEQVGLKAEWISVGSSEQAVSYLNNGLVDVVATVCVNNEEAEEGEILLTNSYRDSFFSVLGKKGTKLQNTTKPPTFVIERGAEIYADFIEKNYPESRILRKNSKEEVFAAIKKGEAKATVVEANMEEYYRLKYDMSLANLTEQFQGIPVCLGVKQSGGGQLLTSILNQGIASLDSSKVNAIVVNNNSDTTIDYSFTMMLKKNWKIIAGIAIFAGIVVTVIMLIRRRYQQERLWQASYLDKVTGQGNYEKMILDIKPLFDGSCEGQYAVCAIDLVKFKNINETYGYGVGNKILEVMAEIISAECKEGEFSARAGGDQFYMMLKGNVTEEHVKRMERLTRRVEREIEKLNSEYRVRCVAGVYLLQDDSEPYYAIDKANLARKAARDSRGRNIEVYDVRMHKRVLKEREIESIMYQALEDEEFQVYLQPRVVIGTGEIVAAEALVRWQRPSGEMIYPDAFIPLFEANGFIREMDFYIYEQVCKMLRERLEKNLPVVPVSVNVSRAHLENGDFIESFNRLMDKYDIPREYIELELTESLLVEDPARMIETADELKANHYTLSIDDFGSGYSSLNILKQLHFDVLKIDKEFLRTEGSKPEDKIILESVIHMAKNLNMQVLVEGVEIEEQQVMLVQMGCDFAQGYYFSRPIPMKDFISLLEKQEAQKKEP